MARRRLRGGKSKGPCRQQKFSSSPAFFGLQSFDEKSINQGPCLVSGLLLATAPAKAEDQGQAVFWYAYTLGAGTSLCSATEGLMVPKGSAIEGRMIPKCYASEYVQGILQESETDPDLTPFKQSFLKAYQELKEFIPGCIE